MFFFTCSLRIVRKFRDTHHAENYFGGKFIQFYYKFGPYSAKIIEKIFFLEN